MDGDGIDDILIGAFFASRDGVPAIGETYLLFGAETSDAVVDLGSLDGGDGFVFRGLEKNNLSGRSIAGAGDINADGFDDILISGYAGGDSGLEAYLAYGGPMQLQDFDLADDTQDGLIDLSLITDMPFV